MSKSKAQKIAATITFTALALAIGCGDGSRHSIGVKHSLPGGATPPPAKTTAGSTTPTTVGSGSTGTGTGGAGSATPAGSSPSAASTQAADEKRLQQLVDAEENTGTQIGVTNLADGTYTLQSFTSHFRFVRNTNIAEVYQESAVQEQNGSYILAPGKKDHFGIMSSSDSAGRTIKVPVSMTIDKVKSPFDPRDTSNLVVVKSMAHQETTGLETTDVLTASGDSNTLNLRELMAGQEADPAGKTISTKILRLQDGSVRVVVSIDEKVINATNATPQNATDGNMFRELILTFQVAPAAASSTPSAAAPAASGATP